jgi:hypothetical protein
MKFAWRKNISDLATWNSAQVEEVDLDEYRELLEADQWADDFDKPEDETVIE